MGSLYVAASVLTSRAVRRALVVVGFLVAARSAHAVPYETFVDVSDQADLEDLVVSGDLTEDTYNELLDLLETGVDLNTANRAQLYALPNLTYEDVDAIIGFRDGQRGQISDPGALVTAGVLSEDKLLSISSFLIVGTTNRDLKIRGWIRAQTRFTIGDNLLPPTLLRGRFTLRKGLTAGFAGVLTRLQVGKPVYDPNRDSLVADARGYNIVLPKIFVKYDSERYAAIAGSFRAGFGQRLVFDNSTQYTANGLYSDDQITFSNDLDRECRLSTGELSSNPCDGEDAATYTTPDWNWRDGLLGVGAGFKRLEVGAGWIQGYLWASIQQRRIYQYELVNAGTCEDPHDDSDPACAAPTIGVRDEDNPLAPAPRHSFQTLPGVFQERLVGANTAYFADRRNSVGLTLYAADEVDLVDGIDLGTQEWSRLPLGTVDSGNTGGVDFGAMGVNFTFGRGWLDVGGEGAFSFDKLADGPGPQSGGGGPAGLLRFTATKGKQELEAVFRYYGIDYANPFARPISQPDEFDGQRARDEVGGRLRYTNTAKRYSIRALLDLWTPISSLHEDSVLGRSQPKLDTYVRADVRTSHQLWLGLWLRYQDKDLRQGGQDQCFEVPTDTTEDGEPIPCAGRQLTTIVRAKYVPDKTLAFTGMLQHQLLDDGLSMSSQFRTKFRQDASAWLIALYRPNPRVRIRARLRYFDEALNDDEDTYLERSFTGLVDTALTIRKRDIVRVRFDVKRWLDGRESTQLRSPNPELTFWLMYEMRL